MSSGRRKAVSNAQLALFPGPKGGGPAIPGESDRAQGHPQPMTDSPVPSHSETGTTVPIDFLRLERSRWRNEFLPYFLNSRRATERSREAVLKRLGFDSTARAAILARGKEERERAGTDATGTLGEAHLSFILERDRQVYLTKAGWKEHPLEVVKGIDLVGLRLNDRLVTLVEAKTWPSIQDHAGLKQAFKEVIKDLALERCDKHFNNSVDSASYLTVASHLKRLLREGKLPKNVVDSIGQKSQELIIPNRYHRHGVVLADTPHMAVDDVPSPEHRNGYPCELLLINIEELSQCLDELVGAEGERMRQELEEMNVRADPSTD